MSELAALKQKSAVFQDQTYFESRAQDGCIKRCIHRIAGDDSVKRLHVIRNMGLEVDITKEKKEGNMVDWHDYKSVQAYHQNVVDAKTRAASSKAASERDSKEALERKSGPSADPGLPAAAPSLAVVASFTHGTTGSALTDEQAQLICAMFAPVGSYEQIQAICSTPLNWNFTAYVPGRTDAITPLSLLCRPELCNALSEIRAHPKEIADGLQLNLIEYAISNGTKDKEVWKTKKPSVDPFFANRRAISDTVYQGRVDILRLLIEYFPEIKTVLRTQMEFGSSYLHMAAHDGRTEMVIFLIDDVEVPIEVESTSDAPKTCRGQTPLFWCFARGVVNVKCAFALVERGADPIRLWHATKDGKRIATLSPLSMALVTAPEFAEKILINQRPRVGNRGLKQVFRPSFVNTLVSEDGQELKFAPQIEPAKPGWETFNYDPRPKSHRTLLQIMIDNKRKKLLQLPIVRFVLHTMWFEFGFQKFILDFFRFSIYVVCVGTTVGLFDSGLRVDPLTKLDFVDFSVRDLKWVIPFAISLAISLTLMAQEVAEMRKLKGKYLLEVKNYWDLCSIFIYWLMGTCMIVVHFSHGLSVEGVVTGDFLIKLCNAILQLTFISGFLEFGAVPKVSGPFVSTIWSMFGDVGRFMVMFVVFYVCFVAAMWPLARDGTEMESGPAFKFLLELLFFWLVAQLDDTTLQTWGRNQELARLVFFVYAIVCTILLLNMLIAMMNNTYTLVQEDAEGEWCMNWARFMCYSYDAASESDKLCVTTFLKECSGKTQEQTLAQMTADEEEKSWVDDVRDGVAVLRSDVTTLSEFVMKRSSGLHRVSTRARPQLHRAKSGFSRLGSATLQEDPDETISLRLSESD
jgi:hypothetical protein